MKLTTGAAYSIESRTEMVSIAAAVERATALALLTGAVQDVCEGDVVLVTVNSPALDYRNTHHIEQALLRRAIASELAPELVAELADIHNHPKEKD